MNYLTFESDFITDIVAAVNASPYPVNGLRIDEAFAFHKGDRIPNSRIYDGGHPTRTTENGVSTYGLSSPVTASEVGFKLEILDYYYLRANLVLVGGYNSSCGRDGGEILIHEGRCVMMWHWPRRSSAPPPFLKPCYGSKDRVDFHLVWHEPYGVRDHWHRDAQHITFNPWLCDRELVADITAAANASQFPCKGLRVDYARLYREGDRVQNSELFFATEPGQQNKSVFKIEHRPQRGVCAFGLPVAVEETAVRQALELIDAGWTRDILVLCGGNHWRPGLDVGEMVISQARCIAMWRWPLLCHAPITNVPNEVKNSPWPLVEHYPFGRRHEFASRRALHRAKRDASGKRTKSRGARTKSVARIPREYAKRSELCQIQPSDG